MAYADKVKQADALFDLLKKLFAEIESERPEPRCPGTYKLGVDTPTGIQFRSDVFNIRLHLEKLLNVVEAPGENPIDRLNNSKLSKDVVSWLHELRKFCNSLCHEPNNQSRYPCKPWDGSGDPAWCSLVIAYLQFLMNQPKYTAMTETARPSPKEVRSPSQQPSKTHVQPTVKDDSTASGNSGGHDTQNNTRPTPVRMKETRQIHEIHAKQSAEPVEKEKEEAAEEVHETLKERGERIRRLQSQFILDQIVQASKIRRGLNSVGPEQK